MRVDAKTSGTSGARSACEPGTAHCLVRRGASWFGLPAVSVREVLARPTIVTVPGAAGTVAGICHVRGQFLPVLRLDGYVSQEAPADSEAVLLVMLGAEEPWGLLADEMTEVVTLEWSPAAGRERRTAHSGRLVNVLDPEAVYRSAASQIERRESANGRGPASAGAGVAAATIET